MNKNMDKNTKKKMNRFWKLNEFVEFGVASDEDFKEYCELASQLWDEFDEVDFVYMAVEFDFD